MATILASFAGSCIQKIQSILTDEVILILGVKKELTDLQRRMKQIQCFINDAEQKSIHESAVNNWLGELRDAMYDADDIVDVVRFKGNNLLEDNPSSSAGKSTACSVHALFSCIPSMKSRHEIAVQIRNLNKRIEAICKDNIFLTLQNIAPNEEVCISDWRNTSSLVEPNLVGKEIGYATTKMVDLVLQNKEKKTYKIAIVGTGGVGKTTLSQKIYNDQRIKGKVGKQAWICVSKECTPVSLLKEILRNVGEYQEQGETVGELQSKLEAAIRGKNLFLVLDDVWQPDVWTNLLRVPLHAAAAAVIVVTTRLDTVAQAIGVDHVHRVELLSLEVGWELLWKSMNFTDEREVHHLQDTGMQIVKKCGGLPLAIRAIASVLATKEKTENQWRKILSSNDWSLDKLPADLRGALYLSYKELPQHLKQCFLYCALYPEDCTIFRNGLVRFWVAEGFIEEKEGQLLEDTAEDYYYELIYRNLLLPEFRSFDLDRCKMHDLLRQLACYLSREECFFGDTESLGGKNMSKLQRMLVVTDKDMLVFPSMDQDQLKVRTLRKETGIPFRVDHSVFKKLLRLRVLDLGDSTIESIPDCIGNLIHMRLLDLDRTGISYIPESIGNLINLQILNLQGCHALHSLPLATTKLCYLRRLGLRNTPIKQVPKGIHRLEFLNDLEGFSVGGGSENGETQDGWQLEELGQLSQLRRLTTIKLERAVLCGADPLLADKNHLKVLKLFCSEKTEKAYAEEAVRNIEKIFEQLIPPRNLEDLVIRGFFGQRYPAWLGIADLSSVTQLTLRNCKFCEYLPPIGKLPNLKSLGIGGATAVSKVGPEFLGCTEAVAFPKLEWLIIEDMPNWEEWSFVEEEDAAGEEAREGGEDGFDEKEKREAQSPKMWLLPHLRLLNIVNCPKLRALPRQLGRVATSLKKLYIRGAGCLQVVVDFPYLSEYLSVQSCDDLERISKFPQVTEFRVGSCSNLRRVEGLCSLRQLWLGNRMEEISSCWVPALQQQHLQLYDEELDIYTWCS